MCLLFNVIISLDVFTELKRHIKCRQNVHAFVQGKYLYITPTVKIVADQVAQYIFSGRVKTCVCV